MKIDMPYEAEWIIKNIRDHGFEAFVVGGCVRDSLLGRTPGDWDITTSARPEEIKKIFGKTVDTGLQHGTVTIIKNHQGYEVTTYRIDGEYLDGRHPESVEFTSNLKEDLKRRDFTINAMAYSHETGIVDEFDGMGDLSRRMVRCVGCAHDRFTEDALRILRAIRFSAQLDFSIEEETWKAIGQIAPNLVHVSKERIQVELTKLLTSVCPEKIVLVERSGISPYVAEGFSEAFAAGSASSGGGYDVALSGPEVDSNAVSPSSEADSDAVSPNSANNFADIKMLPAEKSMRWAGFLRHLSSDQAVRILKGLKLDNETIGNVKAMVGAAALPLKPEKPDIRRALSRLTPYQFDGCLRLKALDGCENIGVIRELWKEIEEAGDCVSLKTLAVNGSDLLKAGVQPGKEIGETLNRLLDAVLEHPELNEKESLMRLL